MAFRRGVNIYAKFRCSDCGRPCMGAICTGEVKPNNTFLFKYYCDIHFRIYSNIMEEEWKNDPRCVSYNPPDHSESPFASGATSLEEYQQQKLL